MTAQIPRERYTARFIKAEKKRSAKGNLMIHASAEILSPAEVTLADGRTVAAAGRKFDCYYTIDPVAEKGLAMTFDIFSTLGLLDNNGEINPELVVEALNSGGFCFDVILDSEEQVQRYPAKPGQTIGQPILDAAGKEISKGWRIKLPNSADYVGRVPTLDGLPEVPPF